MPIHLSTQQRRIIALLAGGKTQAEAATALGLAYVTAVNYLTAARHKNGCQKTEDLIALYNKEEKA